MTSTKVIPGLILLCLLAGCTGRQRFGHAGFWPAGPGQMGRFGVDVVPPLASGLVDGVRISLTEEKNRLHRELLAFEKELDARLDPFVVHLYRYTPGWWRQVSAELCLANCFIPTDASQPCHINLSVSMFGTDICGFRHELGHIFLAREKRAGRIDPDLPKILEEGWCHSTACLPGGINPAPAFGGVTNLAPSVRTPRGDTIIYPQEVPVFPGPVGTLAGLDKMVEEALPEYLFFNHLVATHCQGVETSYGALKKLSRMFAGKGRSFLLASFNSFLAACRENPLYRGRSFDSIHRRLCESWLGGPIARWQVEHIQINLRTLPVGDRDLERLITGVIADRSETGLLPFSTRYLILLYWWNQRYRPFCHTGSFPTGHIPFDCPVAGLLNTIEKRALNPGERKRLADCLEWLTPLVYPQGLEGEDVVRLQNCLSKALSTGDQDHSQTFTLILCCHPAHLPKSPLIQWSCEMPETVSRWLMSNYRQHGGESIAFPRDGRINQGQWNFRGLGFGQLGWMGMGKSPDRGANLPRKGKKAGK